MKENPYDHVHCEACGLSTLLPEIAVRLGGRLRCPAGHTFVYHAQDFYTKDGTRRDIAAAKRNR